MSAENPGMNDSNQYLSGGYTGLRACAKERVQPLVAQIGWAHTGPVNTEALKA